MMSYSYGTVASRLALALSLALSIPAIAVAQSAQGVDPSSGAGQQGASTQSQAEGQPVPSAGETSQGESVTGGVRADKLTDAKFVNQSGDEIGEVVKIVRGKMGGKTQAVVAFGGFLGFGGREVTIPLSDLRLQGDKLVGPQETAGTKDQLKRLPRYKERHFDEVSGDEMVSLSDSGRAASDRGDTIASQQNGVRGSQQDSVRDSQQDGASGSQQNGVRDSQQNGVRGSQQDSVRDSQQDGARDSQPDGARDSQPDGVRDSQRRRT